MEQEERENLIHERELENKRFGEEIGSLGTIDWIIGKGVWITIIHLIDFLREGRTKDVLGSFLIKLFTALFSLVVWLVILASVIYMFLGVVLWVWGTLYHILF